MPKPDLTILIFPEAEKMYIEMSGLIEFLRHVAEGKTESPELGSDDEYYNAALQGVAAYLEEKRNEFLAQHILTEEAQDAKDKGQLQ